MWLGWVYPIPPYAGLGVFHTFYGFIIVLISGTSLEMDCMSRSRWGVSPVIATVILVAVAMVITMAAAYWITGTSGSYMEVEKLQIESSYCISDSSVTNSRWMIVVSLRNNGPSTCNIVYVMVNDAVVDDYNVTAGGSLSNVDSIGTSIDSSGLRLESGESTTAYVWVGSDLFSSGTTVIIRLQSVAGVNYFRPVKLA